MSTALSTMAGKLAARLGMDAGTDLMNTLKNTAFKGGNVTDEQFTALLIVANQYGLNPWTKEIYAFPDKGGSSLSSALMAGPVLSTNIRSLTEWNSPMTRRKARVPAKFTARIAVIRPLSPNTWMSVSVTLSPGSLTPHVCFAIKH